MSVANLALLVALSKSVTSAVYDDISSTRLVSKTGTAGADGPSAASSVDNGGDVVLEREAVRSCIEYVGVEVKVEQFGMSLVSDHVENVPLLMLVVDGSSIHALMDAIGTADKAIFEVKVQATCEVFVRNLTYGVFRHLLHPAGVLVDVKGHFASPGVTPTSGSREPSHVSADLITASAVRVNLSVNILRLLVEIQNIVTELVVVLSGTVQGTDGPDGASTDSPGSGDGGGSPPALTEGTGREPQREVAVEERGRTSAPRMSDHLFEMSLAKKSVLLMYQVINHTSMLLVVSQLESESVTVVQPGEACALSGLNPFLPLRVMYALVRYGSVEEDNEGHDVDGSLRQVVPSPGATPVAFRAELESILSGLRVWLSTEPVRLDGSDDRVMALHMCAFEPCADYKSEENTSLKKWCGVLARHIATSWRREGSAVLSRTSADLHALTSRQQFANQESPSSASSSPTVREREQMSLSQLISSSLNRAFMSTFETGAGGTYLSSTLVRSVNSGLKRYLHFCSRLFVVNNTPLHFKLFWSGDDGVGARMEDAPPRSVRPVLNCGRGRDVFCIGVQGTDPGDALNGSRQWSAGGVERGGPIGSHVPRSGEYHVPHVGEVVAIQVYDSTINADRCIYCTCAYDPGQSRTLRLLFYAPISVENSSPFSVYYRLASVHRHGGGVYCLAPGETQALFSDAIETERMLERDHANSLRPSRGQGTEGRSGGGLFSWLRGSGPSSAASYQPLRNDEESGYGAPEAGIDYDEFLLPDIQFSFDAVEWSPLMSFRENYEKNVSVPCCVNVEGSDAVSIASRAVVRVTDMIELRGSRISFTVEESLRNDTAVRLEFWLRSIVETVSGAGPKDAERFVLEPGVMCPFFPLSLHGRSLWVRPYRMSSAWCRCPLHVFGDHTRKRITKRRKHADSTLKQLGCVAQAHIGFVCREQYSGTRERSVIGHSEAVSYVAIVKRYAELGGVAVVVFSPALQVENDTALPVAVSLGMPPPTTWHGAMHDACDEASIARRLGILDPLTGRYGILEAERVLSEQKAKAKQRGGSRAHEVPAGALLPTGAGPCPMDARIAEDAPTTWQEYAADNTFSLQPGTKARSLKHADVLSVGVDSASALAQLEQANVWRTLSLALRRCPSLFSVRQSRCSQRVAGMSGCDSFSSIRIASVCSVLLVIMRRTTDGGGEHALTTSLADFGSWSMQGAVHEEGSRQRGVNGTAGSEPVTDPEIALEDSAGVFVSAPESWNDMVDNPVGVCAAAFGVAAPVLVSAIWACVLNDRKVPESDDNKRLLLRAADSYWVQEVVPVRVPCDHYKVGSAWSVGSIIACSRVIGLRFLPDVSIVALFRISVSVDSLSSAGGSTLDMPDGSQDHTHVTHGDNGDDGAEDGIRVACRAATVKIMCGLRYHGDSKKSVMVHNRSEHSLACLPMAFIERLHRATEHQMQQYGDLDVGTDDVEFWQALWNQSGEGSAAHRPSLLAAPLTCVLVVPPGKTAPFVPSMRLFYDLVARFTTLWDTASSTRGASEVSPSPVATLARTREGSPWSARQHVPIISRDRAGSNRRRLVTLICSMWNHCDSTTAVATHRVNELQRERDAYQTTDVMSFSVYVDGARVKPAGADRGPIGGGVFQSRAPTATGRDVLGQRDFFKSLTISSIIGVGAVGRVSGVALIGRLRPGAGTGDVAGDGTGGERVRHTHRRQRSIGRRGHASKGSGSFGLARHHRRKSALLTAYSSSGSIPIESAVALPTQHVTMQGQGCALLGPLLPWRSHTPWRQVTPNTGLPVLGHFTIELAPVTKGWTRSKYGGGASHDEASGVRLRGDVVECGVRAGVVVPGAPEVGGPGDGGSPEDTASSMGDDISMATIDTSGDQGTSASDGASRSSVGGDALPDDAARAVAENELSYGRFYARVSVDAAYRGLNIGHDGSERRDSLLIGDRAAGGGTVRGDERAIHELQVPLGTNCVFSCWSDIFGVVSAKNRTSGVVLVMSIDASTLAERGPSTTGQRSPHIVGQDIANRPPRQPVSSSSDDVNVRGWTILFNVHCPLVGVSVRGVECEYAFCTVQSLCVTGALGVPVCPIGALEEQGACHYSHHVGLTIRNLQVDNMCASADYPVILAVDEGWQTPFRTFGGDALEENPLFVHGRYSRADRLYGVHTNALEAFVQWKTAVWYPSGQCSNDGGAGVAGVEQGDGDGRSCGQQLLTIETIGVRLLPLSICVDDALVGVLANTVQWYGIMKGFSGADPVQRMTTMFQQQVGGTAEIGGRWLNALVEETGPGVGDDVDRALCSLLSTAIIHRVTSVRDRLQRRTTDSDVIGKGEQWAEGSLLIPPLRVLCGVVGSRYVDEAVVLCDRCATVYVTEPGRQQPFSLAYGARSGRPAPDGQEGIDLDADGRLGARDLYMNGVAFMKMAGSSPSMASLVDGSRGHSRQASMGYSASASATSDMPSVSRSSSRLTSRTHSRAPSVTSSHVDKQRNGDTGDTKNESTAGQDMGLPDGGSSARVPNPGPSLRDRQRQHGQSRHNHQRTRAFMKALSEIAQFRHQGKSKSENENEKSALEAVSSIWIEDLVLHPIDVRVHMTETSESYGLGAVFASRGGAPVALPLVRGKGAMPAVGKKIVQEYKAALFNLSTVGKALTSVDILSPAAAVFTVSPAVQRVFRRPLESLFSDDTPGSFLGVALNSVGVFGTAVVDASVVAVHRLSQWGDGMCAALSLHPRERSRRSLQRRAHPAGWGSGAILGAREMVEDLHAAVVCPLASVMPRRFLPSYMQDVPTDSRRHRPARGRRLRGHAEGGWDYLGSQNSQKFSDYGNAQGIRYGVSSSSGRAGVGRRSLVGGGYERSGDGVQRGGSQVYRGRQSTKSRVLSNISHAGASCIGFARSIIGFPMMTIGGGFTFLARLMEGGRSGGSYEPTSRARLRPSVFGLIVVCRYDNAADNVGQQAVDGKRSVALTSARDSLLREGRQSVADNLLTGGYVDNNSCDQLYQSFCGSNCASHETSRGYSYSLPQSYRPQRHDEFIRQYVIHAAAANGETPETSGTSITASVRASRRSSGSRTGVSGRVMVDGMSTNCVGVWLFRLSEFDSASFVSQHSGGQHRASVIPVMQCRLYGDLLHGHSRVSSDPSRLGRLDASAYHGPRGSGYQSSLQLHGTQSELPINSLGSGRDMDKFDGMSAYDIGTGGELGYGLATEQLEGTAICGVSGALRCRATVVALRFIMEECAFVDWVLSFGYMGAASGGSIGSDNLMLTQSDDFSDSRNWMPLKAAVQQWMQEWLLVTSRVWGSAGVVDDGSKQSKAGKSVSARSVGVNVCSRIHDARHLLRRDPRFAWDYCIDPAEAARVTCAPSADTSDSDVSERSVRKNKCYVYGLRLVPVASEVALSLQAVMDAASALTLLLHFEDGSVVVRQRMVACAMFLTPTHLLLIEAPEVHVVSVDEFGGSPWLSSVEQMSASSVASSSLWKVKGAYSSSLMMSMEGDVFGDGSVGGCDHAEGDSEDGHGAEHAPSVWGRGLSGTRKDALKALRNGSGSPRAGESGRHSSVGGRRSRISPLWGDRNSGSNVTAPGSGVTGSQARPVSPARLWDTKKGSFKGRTGGKRAAAPMVLHELARIPLFRCRTPVYGPWRSALVEHCRRQQVQHVLARDRTRHLSSYQTDQGRVNHGSCSCSDDTVDAAVMFEASGQGDAARASEVRVRSIALSSLVRVRIAAEAVGRVDLWFICAAGHVPCACGQVRIAHMRLVVRRPQRFVARVREAYAALVGCPI